MKTEEEEEEKEEEMIDLQDNNRNKRIRINFKVSSKGIVTPEVTCEMLHHPRSIVLVEATRLLDEAIIIARERSDINTK